MGESQEISKEQFVEKAKQQEPSVDVQLPSGGIIYPEDKPMSKGTLTMRYMKGEDEEILISPSYMKSNRTFDVLLRKLIMENNFDPLDLSIADKEYLILSARIVSLGEEFEAENVACRKCGFENESQVMKLSDIKENKILHQPDEPHTNAFSLELPASKHQIKIKVITARDQKEIEQQLKSSPHVSDGAVLSYSVAKSIVEAPNVDPDRFGTKVAFYKNLPLKDAKHIRQHLSEISGGTDFGIDYTCPKCDRTQEITVDFGLDFFF